MNKIIFILFLLSLVTSSFSQPWFPKNGEVFKTGIMPRVDIGINEDSLAWLYENIYSGKEFKAQFIYTTEMDSDTLNDIGFGLKGNTSLQSAKKSFKISFNTFKSGRKYNGLEKMNMNGEHNDPSVIRSHLVWNIFSQMHVPCPRSNHVDVYINNRYYGLYINVEHIDEEFVESRFDNKLGNLYKCLNPASLKYLGADEQKYKDTGYSLQTNTERDDFSDLVDFISKLNTTTSANMPSDIEPIFNMNGFLRYLAVEIFTGHWDGYSGNKNNYYLYNNAYTGKFEFIPYDVDNTFGIDWFGIDWANRDIYHWWSDWEDMPLTSKTFGNQVYVDRFSYFMNELITKYADTSIYFPEIDAIQNKINASAEADPYRPLDYGWSFDDFKESYNHALGFHVAYGLKEYISARITSIKEQIVLNPIAPIIENVYHNFPGIADEILIKADITDDEPNYTAKIYYNINGGSGLSASMIDKGDLLFDVVLPGLTESGKMAYYIEAKDADGKISREPFSGEYTINIGPSNAKLVVNEFMASNQSTILDNYGEYEDWIEIYNAGNETVDLLGKYLTDDIDNKTKWSFPQFMLEPGDYYLVWADDDAVQGDNHANFKLSQSGETIGIFDSFESNYSPIDTFSYGEQETDFSFGTNVGNNMGTQAFVTPFGENGSANLAYLNISYNMNQQINLGNFAKNVDFIDLAGTFNNWEGSVKIFDGDNDGLHTATLFGFSDGVEIQYKARILGDWSGGEFPDLGDAGNRSLMIAGGANEMYHLFNDEPVTVSDKTEPLAIIVYPNPVNEGPLNITSNKEIMNVEIYNSAGLLVSRIAGTRDKTMTLTHKLSSGIYIIKTESIADFSISKIVVF